ncbi:MAG TPA: hypothetical protein VME41_16005 [Stellaceae bacterium]|nr:hypothetical protein [Stellaceae bacterium]
MAETAKFIQQNPHTAFEDKDWSIGLVGWLFLATLALLIISPFVLLAAFPRSMPDQSRRLLVEPAAPRLQIAPYLDLASFQVAEDRKLDTYYWIDKSKGIVHIPIAAAMQKLARRGITGFPQAPR